MTIDTSHARDRRLPGASEPLVTLAPLTWGGWRTEPAEHVVDLQDRANEIRARGGQVDRALTRLTEAVNAMSEAVGSHKRVRSWWDGRDRERTWALLHEAEELLVEQPTAGREWVIETVQRHQIDLGTRDPARLAFKAAEQANHGVGSAARVLLHDAHLVATRRAVQTRRFRNRLLGAAVMALAVAFALVITQAQIPRAQLLENTQELPLVTWQLMALAMIGGLVGGLIGALRIVTTKTLPRYEVTSTRALLRVSMGVLTGLLGVMLLSTGWIVSGSLKSTAMLLVSAIAFGAAQEIVTKTFEAKVGKDLAKAEEDTAKAEEDTAKESAK